MHSQFNPRRVPGVVNTKPSVTQQHFRDECNINTIMAKARRGILPSMFFVNRAPWYGDFSEGLSFQDMQNVLVGTQAAFMELDARIRSRFHNDPGELIAFCEDPANRDEAIKLGLIDKPEEKPAAKPAENPPAAAGSEPSLT